MSDYSYIVISIFINEPSFEGQTKKNYYAKASKQLENLIQNEFFVRLNSPEITKTLLETLMRDLYTERLNKIKELERKSIKREINFLGNWLIAQANKLKTPNCLLLKVIVQEVQPSKPETEILSNSSIKGKILNVFSVSLARC